MGHQGTAEPSHCQPPTPQTSPPSPTPCTLSLPLGRASKSPVQMQMLPGWSPVCTHRLTHTAHTHTCTMTRHIYTHNHQPSNKREKNSMSFLTPTPLTHTCVPRYIHRTTTTYVCTFPDNPLHTERCTNKNVRHTHGYSPIRVHMLSQGCTHTHTHTMHMCKCMNTHPGHTHACLLGTHIPTLTQALL